MRIFRDIILPMVLFFSASANSTYKDTFNVKVDLLSAWSISGAVLVQTDPRPNITGLSCSNDYWLILNKVDLGYDAMFSMLLVAQTMQTPIIVRAENNGNNQFCHLSRVITLPSH